MKKKITSLMLNKKCISNLQIDQVTGGFEKVSKKCPISNNNLCDTDLCASHARQTCTVTYDKCFTEFKGCGKPC